MISRLEAWVFVVCGLLGITVKAARQGGSVDWCGGSRVKEKKKESAVVEGGTDRSEWSRLLQSWVVEGRGCSYP
jgi:hypothetical protein